MRFAVNEHIQKNLPFLNGKKLLVAISGGIDSVVLTHILYKLKFNITLAHCNFMLRGKESNKDEQFVEALGEKMGLPTYIIQFDTLNYAEENGISTQMAARDLRYNWFQKLCVQHQIDYIVTAHQKDDVIETVLINLTRGTGLDGLTGIPEVNNNVVRPLLPFSRNEVLVYATRKKLQWQEDSTNSSIKYVRNKIRHKVIPYLKEINPSLLETFSNTLENFKGSQQIIEDRIEEIKEKVISKNENKLQFSISELKKLSNPKVYLYEILKEYGFSEWDDISNLLDAQSGKQVFSNTHRLLKDREALILSEINIESNVEYFEVSENTPKIKEPVKLKFKKVDIPFDTRNHQNKVFGELILDEPTTISIDYDKIEFPLIIRKWEKGDYFYPIGLNGKKKLSKFFKDEKISIIDKEKTWLLCSKDDIVWVIGKRLDDRFKVSKTTSTILKIKM